MTKLVLAPTAPSPSHVEFVGSVVLHWLTCAPAPCTLTCTVTLLVAVDGRSTSCRTRVPEDVFRGLNPPSIVNAGVAGGSTVITGDDVPVKAGPEPVARI